MKFLSLLPLLAILACNTDPQVQAQRYVENGNKFFDRDKYKEASIMYRRALQKAPRFGEAYYRLALTDLELQAYGDAAQMLLRAVELQPDNSDAAMKLADLYVVASAQDTTNREQMLEEASGLADKLLAMDADSYDGHRILGQIAFLGQDAATAVKELEIAHNLKPEETGIMLVYFQALVANQQSEDAERVARELISQDKTYSPIYDLLYAKYRQEDRVKDGEDLLRLKLNNNPNNAAFALQLAAHYYLTQQRPKMDEVMALLGDEKRFPSGRLLAGDFYFLRLREYEAAQREYEAGLEAFPDQESTYKKRLVELFAMVGRDEDANRLLTELLDEDPNDPDVIAMRSALRLNTGSEQDINLAVIDLQSLVSKNPNNHTYRFNLARALIAKKEIPQARLELEEAVKLRADFVAARELLARLYLMGGEAPLALQAAEDILKIDANHVNAHLIRSSALLVMGQRDEAQQELDYITANFPQNTNARFQQGYMAWQNGDLDTASQLFGDLYEENPQDMRGLVGIVETLASQRRMGEAIATMKGALAAEPDRQDMKIALGNLYVRAAQYDEAIAMYKEVLDKEPNLAAVLFRLGETYRRKGDLNVAIDTFQRASQAAPNDPAPLLQMGLLMDGTGRREQAKPVYEQILKLEPDHPIALNNLAFIKAEEGVDLDQAMSMAQRARQKMPDSPDISDTLGWIYIKKNLSDQAVGLFTQLVQNNPNNPSFRYHYGLALRQKGDVAGARRELEAALLNSPSKEEEGEIQELLRQL